MNYRTAQIYITPATRRLIELRCNLNNLVAGDDQVIDALADAMLRSVLEQDPQLAKLAKVYEDGMKRTREEVSAAMEAMAKEAQ